MADYTDTAFERGDGFYRVTYGGLPRPIGPFESVADLARVTEMDAYPSDGYVVEVEDGLAYTVPSLNPDDLMVPA